ncbi:6-hydroxymethylpterin diphosphokinase MptE-like protein [Marinobacter sp. CA1]|uniref:motility associated factor glycosyltransferase family protein n=1 Tax=Marinobacter sp. CA1 TaxID=2817656 RepID=UPI001D08A56C|nr:6-hydroxymethylpterin diphosphokinase MptE-like protein [Marinobacter sp. CA1]UDL03790.1 motility associated factor glycosyltransferase family protein [Marinobacter sp. CA1]
MKRKEKNLNFFKRTQPAIYQIFANMMLSRVELVVTPGATDVDMTVDGKSCYRGLAKEYSVDEAERFLKENPPGKKIHTFAPPWPESYRHPRFATLAVRSLAEKSPINRDNFQGYERGNVFPSVVFLGCGLGYHIEALVEKATIINAIVVEREPEKFAVSLFTVDWEKICSRFQKKGHTLQFAIGSGQDPQSLRNLLSSNLSKNIPFHPFFTTYYNHLADIELARTAIEVSKDIAVMASHWSNYDNELRRLLYTLHNLDEDARYLRNIMQPEHARPLVVVGSGPSLDGRIGGLKAVRDKVVIVSSGTGLRPLLAAGIRPDFHVELDPDYIVYKFLNDLDKEALSEIRLLAVHEVNPLVSELFRETFYFFKTDHNLSALGQVTSDAFNHCNPTCTNSALSIAFSLGFRDLYLFGTDYGFRDSEHDHAETSVYGRKAETEFSRVIQERRKLKRRSEFEIPAVDGGTVRTINGYYAAKRAVEVFIQSAQAQSAQLAVSNCSDGAVIEGAGWLSSEEFMAKVAASQVVEPSLLEMLLRTLSAPAPGNILKDQVPEIEAELKRRVQEFNKLLREARMGGRKDLCLQANRLRSAVTSLRPPRGQAQPTAIQYYVYQLLGGSILHFIYVGLCHGMACEEQDLVPYLKIWKQGFLDFLVKLPDHFHQVLVQRPSVTDDPWVSAQLIDPEPESSNRALG